MIGLVRRVSKAAVHVDGRIVGEVSPGLLAPVYAERGDTIAEADCLLEKLLNYRVLSDTQDKMNLPVRNIGGNGQADDLLVVSQFMLTTDTKSGTRPSFTPAAAPEDGRRLCEHFVTHVRVQHPIVTTGEFGADMKVSLVNDGPVTFWL